MDEVREAPIFLLIELLLFCSWCAFNSVVFYCRARELSNLNALLLYFRKRRAQSYLICMFPSYCLVYTRRALFLIKNALFFARASDISLSLSLHSRQRRLSSLIKKPEKRATVRENRRFIKVARAGCCIYTSLFVCKKSLLTAPFVFVSYM